MRSVLSVVGPAAVQRRKAVVSCFQKQRKPEAGEEQEERAGFLEQSAQGLLLATLHGQLQS